MARIHKKDIYAKHGIQFKNGKILFDNEWIPELLQKGNSKTGKKVLTWSTTPGTDGTCVCNCKGCYAKSGFYCFPKNKKTLARNTEIVNDHLNFFYHAVSAQLEWLELKSDHIEWRINAAGDLNSKNPHEYAKTLHLILEEHKKVLGWTYTKMQEFEHLFDDLENGNIVKSIINDVGYNFGKCKYLIDTYKKLKAQGASVWLCRCGVDKNQHCENCKHCATAQFVLFIEHSTGYRPEEDPYFNELKELIENQEQ